MNAPSVGSQKCGIQTIDATIDRFQPGEEEFYTPDNWASQTGEIYFYSPEQLDGSKGVAEPAQPLRLSRSGAPQFVTTLPQPARPYG